MKRYLLIPVYFFIFCVSTAQAWDVRIKNVSMTQEDDSLRIEMWLNVSSIQVPSSRACWLLPILDAGNKTQQLSPVVVSGKERHRFDYREQTFTTYPYPPVYRTLMSNNLHKENQVHYVVTVPYLSWMANSKLVLTQLEKDCCDFRVLTIDTLQAYTSFQKIEQPKVLSANVPSTPRQEISKEEHEETLTEQEAPAKKAVSQKPTATLGKETLHSESITLYIDYPVNEVRILPKFNYNTLELAKLERLLWPLLNKGTISIRTMQVCGYASPEGRYDENERLASTRTRGFMDYVLKTYPVSPSILKATHVAEDWDGLVKLLKEKHPPYYKEALEIIRSQGVFDGRERELMNLRGGTVYTTMCASMFPLLRRIEITVKYELCVKDNLR